VNFKPGFEGKPDKVTLTDFTDRYGIDAMEGKADGAVMFDGNGPEFIGARGSTPAG
jgi:hypothetical protein